MHLRQHLQTLIIPNNIENKATNFVESVVIVVAVSLEYLVVMVVAVSLENLAIIIHDQVAIVVTVVM